MCVNAKTTRYSSLYEINQTIKHNTRNLLNRKWLRNVKVNYLWMTANKRLCFDEINSPKKCFISIVQVNIYIRVEVKQGIWNTYNCYVTDLMDYSLSLDFVYWSIFILSLLCFFFCIKFIFAPNGFEERHRWTQIKKTKNWMCHKFTHHHVNHTNKLSCPIRKTLSCL